MKILIALLAVLVFHPAYAEELKDFKITNPPSIGTVPGLGKIPVGGLSGLILERIDPKTGLYHFLSFTDRGLNSEPENYRNDGIMDRILILPAYSPLLVEIVFDPKAGRAKFGKITPMKNPNGSATTGRSNVNPRGTETIVDEGIVDSKKVPLAMDPWGIDTESMAADSEGFLWLGEEYGPSILKIARDGRILSRFLPDSAPKERAGVRSLPSIFAEREPNRGFEALTIKGDSLFAFLQSPIKKVDGPLRVRVLEFDLKTERPKGVYLYELSKEGAKLGDATLDNSGNIVVLEQGVDKKTKTRHQSLFELDFSKATNLLNPVPEGAKIEVANAIKIASLGSLATGEFEKLEGLAALPDGSFAILNDNDFNVELQVAKIHKKPLPKTVDNHLFILKK